MARPLDLTELVEHFTLCPNEQELLRNKSGANRLGFSLFLKYLLWKARFPRGRAELPENCLDFVGKQVGVAASEIAFYDWGGRQIKRHRTEIRRVTGFRECSVADADKLTDWLSEEVCQDERRPERVREGLLRHCREEKIEPPTPGRIGTIIGSALAKAEQTLTTRISSRLSVKVTGRMVALIEGASDETDLEVDPETLDGREVFAMIKADPGNVSLRTTKEEVDKLKAVRAIGLPPKVFAGVAPKVLAAWRSRAAVEAPRLLAVTSGSGPGVAGWPAGCGLVDCHGQW